MIGRSLQIFEGKSSSTAAELGQFSINSFDICRWKKTTTEKQT